MTTKIPNATQCISLTCFNLIEDDINLTWQLFDTVERQLVYKQQRTNHINPDDIHIHLPDYHYLW